MAPRPVLGRTDELAVINEVIGAFPDGPRALVLVGEAGIGKTVLWEAAVDQARDRGDITVLTSRASAAESDLAYVVLTDLIGPIAAAALPTLPGPQAEALATALLLEAPAPDKSVEADRTRAIVDPRTIGTAVLGVLRSAATEHPLLLAIDDAQWIDGASAAALEFALRRATDLPIGTLLTIRTASPTTPRPSIAALLGDRTRDIEVGPISLGVLHHLVRDRTGAALSRPQLVRLAEASRGNPLLAIEIAREVGRLDQWPIPGEPLPVPSDVAGLLGERLGRLSELERAVLFVAAAMSSPTTTGVATTLDDEVGEPPGVRGALDHAIDVGLLESTADGRLRFAHPLMAEAALRAVSPARARHLHTRLAGLALTAEDRGRHVALAADGPSAEAAAVVWAAAQAARIRGATSVAAGWAEAAVRLTPVDQAAARAERQIAAGRWFADAGEVERGRALLERAIAEMAPGDLRAAARLALAQVSGWDAGPAAVVEGCETALAEAHDPDLRARIRLRLAGEPDVVGFPAAIAHAEAAVGELEGTRDPDPDLLACALLRWAEVRFEAGIGNDVAAVERGRALLAKEPRRTGDGDLQAESLRAHAISWQWAADHDDLELGLAGALADLRRARDLGMDRPVPINEAEIAYLLAWSGDLSAAADHAQASVEAAELVGARESRSAAIAATGVVLLLRGDLVATEEAAHAGLTLAADPPDWLDARHTANLGAAALTGGDAGRASEVLGELFDRFVGLGARESTNHRFAGDLVEAAVAAGDLPRARGVVEALEASTRTVPRPWVVVMAARGRALVHAAEGDLDAADAAARAALEAADELPMPVERARTELIAGRIARRRKEKRRAGDLLDRAAAGFGAVGARAWLAIAESDLARLGRRRGDGDELTETEDRVARLAATGLTNREVGEAAFLTAKSVEGVLGRVYGKLGIRSRAELGAWLAGQGEASAPETAGRKH